MYKFKIFRERKKDELEKKLNEFDKDKIILDVQFSTTSCATKTEGLSTVFLFYSVLVKYCDDVTGEDENG